MESKENGAKQADSKAHIGVKIDNLESMEILSIPGLMEVNEIEGNVQIVKRPNMADKMIVTKPNSKMAHHLKPLFMQGHMNRIPIPRMMVDNGVAVNILPSNMMKRLRKTIEDLVPTDIVVSSFTGKARNTDKDEVVKADLKPFMAEVYSTQVVYYYDDEKENNKGRGEHESAIHYANAIFEIDNGLPILSMTDKLAVQPTNIEEMQVQVKDDITEVDLRDDHKSRPTYICAHLITEQNEWLTRLLKEFIDYFA
ncbi:hypothetical protein ACH5RR_033808 [Cinchona calisaya]|uniref:Uncharacterized protein n=1 Tax=Cinchona calisaya TaxID=153742 RepID=A0ABD2Y925_9GENT